MPEKQAAGLTHVRKEKGSEGKTRIKVDPWIKELAAKHGDLRSVLWLCMVEKREPTLKSCPLTSVHTK